MLPDEIISEILSPALKVSDELFSDTSEVSPFADYSPSTSAYLLVCKDWLRVATPLLYNVVILRSKAQANALEKVLRSNPDFGRFVKKLRVEGGYGPAMHAILQSTPNITDIFLSLLIWSSDGTQGLCKGLPLINPHRVIVVDPPIHKPLKNQHLAALAKALFRCIPTRCFAPGRASHGSERKRGDVCGVFAGGSAVPADGGFTTQRAKAAGKSGSEGDGTRARPNPYAKATEGTGGWGKNREDACEEKLFGGLKTSASTVQGEEVEARLISSITTLPSTQPGSQARQPELADNLRIFGFPYRPLVPYLHSDPIWAEKANNLAEALTHSKTVHTILLDKVWEIPGFLNILRKIPSLKVLQFQTPFNEFDQRIITAINSDAQLKALARYTLNETEKSTLVTPDIAPSLNTSFVPMESATDETREIVWKRVLFFAMYVEEFQSPDFSRRPTELYPSRLPILLVSKYFNRLAIPYIYDSPKIGALALTRQLRDRPDLGSFIRTISMPRCIVPEDDMLTILSYANNLEKIQSFPGYSMSISAKCFDLLGQTAGGSLQEFSNMFPDVCTISSCVLAHFTELRVLKIWACGITFPSDPPPDALGKLQTLDIMGCDVSFLQAVSMMRLASLQTLKLDHGLNRTGLVQFLNAHGARLVHLTVGFSQMEDLKLFDICRALVDIEFFETCNLTRLACDTPHECLTKIIAPELVGDLEDISLDMFPALREIQMRNYKWPTSEREISKNKWVPLAEALLEKNIKLNDSAGKHWISRVKSTRARRR
ncbi:hypothetical protein C8R44DRAFT_975071 [Mycena epipterygia]|nr:hypothetical protein C8R44DRAFT_975071 [Mycena epipterygia]